MDWGDFLLIMIFGWLWVGDWGWMRECGMIEGRWNLERYFVDSFDMFYNFNYRLTIKNCVI